MSKIVLLRHGESVWNRDNLFTGWTDVDLDETGYEQAHTAAKLIKEAGFNFDVTYTSYLKRSIKTLWIVLEDLDQLWVSEYKSWRLNERHYGALQGLNKSETARKYGEDQVKTWRRSYDVRPPALGPLDDRDPVHDPLYRSVPPDLLPHTESLKDTFNRVFPYWTETIAPQVQAGKEVLIVAHGNTFRALIKYFDDLSDQEVTELNLPIGEPLVYELNEDLKATKHYFLNSPEEIEKGVQRQIQMGKAHLLEVG